MVFGLDAEEYKVKLNALVPPDERYSFDKKIENSFGFQDEFSFSHRLRVCSAPSPSLG